MKRDGHQQIGTAGVRICNCKPPWSSPSGSSSSLAAFADDVPWPLPATGAASFKGATCGKCNRPRPVGAKRRSAAEHKSMGKAKGARKVRSCDVALNHRLVSWRVVDRGVDGMARAGVSASGIVGYLAGFHREDYGDDSQYDEEVQEGPVGASYYNSEVEMGCEAGDVVDGGDQKEEEGPMMMMMMMIGGIEDGGGDTDDDMGFCEVGYVWDYVDEEDWCVVGEL